MQKDASFPLLYRNSYIFAKQLFHSSDRREEAKRGIGQLGGVSYQQSEIYRQEQGGEFSQGNLDLDGGELRRESHRLLELDFRFAHLGRRGHRALSDGFSDLFFCHEHFAGGRACRHIDHHGGARRLEGRFRRTARIPHIHDLDGFYGAFVFPFDVLWRRLASRVAGPS